MHPKFMAAVAGYLTQSQTDVFMKMVTSTDVLSPDVRYICMECGASWMSNCMDLECCCVTGCDWNPNLEV